MASNALFHVDDLKATLGEMSGLEDIFSRWQLPALPPLQYFYVPVQINAPFVSTEGLLPVISAIHTEIAEVKVSLNTHQELLEEILVAVRGNTSEVEVDDISDPEARNRVLGLFKDSTSSLFYDDIAERLKLPLRQTVEICNQLESEGLIGEPRTKH